MLVSTGPPNILYSLNVLQLEGDNMLVSTGPPNIFTSAAGLSQIIEQTESTTADLDLAGLRLPLSDKVGGQG